MDLREGDTRIPLKVGQVITLSLAPDGSGSQKYIIQSVAGAGGSTICYNAVRVRDGAIGKLKEFYPYEGENGGFCALDRCEDGQLVPRAGTIRTFSDLCEDYLETYKLLNRTIAASPRNQILKNYIQSGDVLYGSPNQEILEKYPLETDGTDRHHSSSVYIWSNGLAGMGFDEYVADVRRNPTQRANRKLYDVLNITRTLADSICVIHTAGMVHLDIKPSNFLVPYDSTGELNTNCVSLFDISTFYSADSAMALCEEGTDGYRAPELSRGKIDNRSDIYSIGAMLFHSLVVSDDLPDGYYRGSYYPDIDRLVRYSALIRSSGAGVKLVAQIARILKNCLACDPRDRYQDCDDLLADLKKAVDEADRNAKPVGQNKKLAIVEVNEASISSPDMVIQKMLYDHPLYEVLTPGKTRIRVLVIGSGTYGQKFIDRCLQVGQMEGYSLSITAVSSTPEEDRENYLQFRPELSRFVNVNGSMEGKPEAYGTLRFMAINEACGDSDMLSFVTKNGKARNEKIVGKLLARSEETEPLYDYIFIALGNVTLNRQIANLCRDVWKSEGKKLRCPVCYISQRKSPHTGAKQDSMLYPVYADEPVTPETIDPLLEQMAFNVDLSWNSSLNMDISAAFEAFRGNEYNYGSSMAYALSIPYKLFSVGIVLQNQIKPFCGEQFPGFVLAENVEQAAALYAERILSRMDTDKEAKKQFDTLVYLEHRRWVLSLVCESWVAPRDERGQLDLGRFVTGAMTRGKVNDRVNRIHPCIVFGTEKTPLSSPLYEGNRRAKWDEDRIDPELDELDRVSVELHQRFRDYAIAVKASNPLRGEDVLAIEELIAGADECVIRAYKQFLFCLKNILNGVESYTRQYDYYVSCFTDELSRVPETVRDEVNRHLAQIQKTFFPVIETNLYRNYKAIDEVLLKKLPFILTYRFRDTVALAFEDGKHQNGRNEAVFANVASATVLSPDTILYLYHYTKDTGVELLTGKLAAVLKYLGKRKVHCKVSLAVTFQKSFGGDRRAGLQAALEALKADAQKNRNATFVGYHILDCDDGQDAVTRIVTLMEDYGVSLYDGSTALFDSLLDNSALLSELRQADVPYFEFDWRRKRVTKHLGCEYLRYIWGDSSIRINDMFALMQAEDTRFHLPEFAEDYQTLWDIYTGRDIPGFKFNYSVGNWNNLCRLLEEYEKNQDPLATIHLVPGDDSDRKETDLVYVLPEYTTKTVRMLLDKLTNMDVIHKQSRVFGYTSENCKVEITTDERYKPAFDRLFARPELFLSFYGMDVKKWATYDGESIQFVYCNMKVQGLNLDPEGRGRGRFGYGILERLEKKQFIRHLTAAEGNPNVVSFEYASRRIKKLLTTAGEILEVYTYYQLLNTGYFDDVACGYEFRWQDGQVKNELDIVAVKGFRSIIVECKAVQKLELEYYHKLHSIAEHFGIGTRKVLVGNTYSFRENDTLLDNSNRMQQSRGRQLGILTISDETQIVNIGQTLMDIIQSEE